VYNQRLLVRLRVQRQEHRLETQRMNFAEWISVTR
jgi:hypothetical protein